MNWLIRLYDSIQVIYKSNKHVTCKSWINLTNSRKLHEKFILNSRTIRLTTHDCDDTMLARHTAKLAKLIQTGEENKKKTHGKHYLSELLRGKCWSIQEVWDLDWTNMPPFHTAPSTSLGHRCELCTDLK
jgi:hypothetical protein